MKRDTILKRPKKFVDTEDTDNPGWTEEMLGIPVIRPSRGKQKEPTKVSTTIRLDADVLAYYRATGPGYQSRIDEILRASIEKK